MDWAELVILRTTDIGIRAKTKELVDVPDQSHANRQACQTKKKGQHRFDFDSALFLSREKKMNELVIIDTHRTVISTISLSQGDLTPRGLRHQTPCKKPYGDYGDYGDFIGSYY